MKLFKESKFLGGWSGLPISGVLVPAPGVLLSFRLLFLCYSRDVSLFISSFINCRDASLVRSTAI